jgi:hypothetical protein
MQAAGILSAHVCGLSLADHGPGAGQRHGHGDPGHLPVVPHP